MGAGRDGPVTCLVSALSEAGLKRIIPPSWRVSLFGEVGLSEGGTTGADLSSLTRDERSFALEGT